MSNQTPTAGPALADDLLYGFDICDEETKLFLGSLIASGQVPQEELDELQGLSLGRGVEEWDMLFDCASALRERSDFSRRGDDMQVERSLVPFLEAVLTEGSVQLLRPAEPARLRNGTEAKVADQKDGKDKACGPRKKRLGKGVSPFWLGSDDASEMAGTTQRRQVALDPLATAPCQGSSRDIFVVANQRAAAVERASNGAMVFGSQDTMVAPSGNTEVLAMVNAASWDTVTEEPPITPGRSALLNSTLCSYSEQPRSNEQPVKATGGSRSPFFSTSTPTRVRQPDAGPTLPSTKKKIRPPRGTVSSLPIPPLSADRFGLIQEELASDPFRLLIAITFLIRTTGKAAIPVFRQLMERYPTPEALAAANPAEIIALIHPLGLSAVRCGAIQKYAAMWLEKPPTRDMRYGVKNYPQPGDGRHIRVGEEFGPEDGDGVPENHQPVDAAADARERAIGCAWEIGHLTQGPYALDSWRIFCRDVLLGRSTHWTGKGNSPGFQPEWMRVLPRDKELRACLRWMWYVYRSVRRSPPVVSREARTKQHRARLVLQLGTRFADSVGCEICTVQVC